MPRRTWTHWGAMVGLLWLAALLRWMDLPHLPYGLWYDEAYYGLDALRVLEGHLTLFFPENNGREPLFIYLVAGAIAILGPTPYALRLTASMIGLLAVAATFRMAWTLSRRWEVGMLSGILMAFLLWPLNLSRVGFRAGLFPLAAALTLWSFTRAARSGRGRDWVIAGLIWGGGFYTYLAARMTILPIAMGLILGRQQDPRRFSLRPCPGGCAARVRHAECDVCHPDGSRPAGAGSPFAERGNHELGRGGKSDPTSSPSAPRRVLISHGPIEWWTGMDSEEGQRRWPACPEGGFLRSS